jgi:hypothetical protein
VGMASSDKTRPHIINLPNICFTLKVIISRSPAS